MSDPRRVVLVTGASSGIGREAALRFADSGCVVGLLARRGARLRQAGRAVAARGGEPRVLVADVTDRTQVEAAVVALAAEFRRLDVLVNNAGSVVYGSVEECRDEDFERQAATNFLGAVYATKAALPVMLRRRSGAVVNVGSLNAGVFFPYNAAYSASKAALRAFSLTLRRELIGSGVSVSLVSPGYTDTEVLKAAVRRGPERRQTLFKPLDPARVADVIVACADRPRREVALPLAAGALTFAYATAPPAARWFLAVMNLASRLKSGPKLVPRRPRARPTGRRGAQ